VSPSSSNSSSSTKSWSARSKAIKNTETIRLQFDSSAVLKNAIKNFNSTVDDRFKIDLNDDGITFIGYVRVAVRLQRPVNILKIGKINDRQTKEMMQFEKFTKRLHLTSQTTCQDVIEALVKRYNIQDCIRKFAIYERKQKTKEHYTLERLTASHRPLLLRLMHGTNAPDAEHVFVFQEADIDGVQWEQFNFTELHSFLKIIDIEESKQLQEVHTVFNKFKSILQYNLQ